MKKIILFLLITLPIISNAQVFGYGFLNVPEDEIQEYIENEEVFYSKVAQEAIKNGHMEGWSIWKRVEGSVNEPNFYWYVGIGNLDAYNSFTENFSKAYSKIISQTGVSKLVERALKKHNSYHSFTGTYYRGGIARRKNMDGFRYLKANYAKVSNPQQFMQKQNEVWKPFIQKHMDNGKAKQEIWATSMRINPTGNGYNWNVMTIDGYDSLNDTYNSFPGGYQNLDFPSQKDMSDTNPENGWHKSTLWERVMWIDSNGELKKN